MIHGTGALLDVEGIQKLNEMIQRKAKQRTQRDRLEPMQTEQQLLDSQLSKQMNQLEYAAYFSNNNQQ